MDDRRRSPSREHEETIAAFDRERIEAHELRRRHDEMITNSRRNDRPYRHNRDERDR